MEILIVEFPFISAQLLLVESCYIATNCITFLLKLEDVSGSASWESRVDVDIEK